ncbi:hypothetical protein ABT369_46500 [Dactylosporangium sp. NPDC000244]|uniref:hypothetical protein n=1 Tax=Dactylosporangium sp. NPDC000244 TaxID=3154365 RepID=UPI0033323E7C
MATLIGVLVLAVLWLACAVAALRVAARLARQYEHRMRHAHGDALWSRLSSGGRAGPSAEFRLAVRRWAAARNRLFARVRHRVRPADERGTGPRPRDR